MEPIPVALLGAIAGGSGGDSGRDAWASLRALVSRPFRRSGTSGTAALTALERTPSDPDRAQVLSQVLTARADIDPEFETALARWLEETSRVLAD